MTDGDHMAMITDWLKVDADHVALDLQHAREDLHRADGELFLDFSSVRRIDTAALASLDELSAHADEQGVRVVLRGVNVEVYKVLKLVKLAPHFSFIC